MKFTFSVSELLGKFGPKIQNCLFKVKFDTKTNSNMQNSMVVSIKSYPLWTFLVQKIATVSLS